jgi:hypothetical protein
LSYSTKCIYYICKDTLSHVTQCLIHVIRQDDAHLITTTVHLLWLGIFFLTQNSYLINLKTLLTPQSKCFNWRLFQARGKGKILQLLFRQSEPIYNEERYFDFWRPFWLWDQLYLGQWYVHIIYKGTLLTPWQLPTLLWYHLI